MRNKNLFTILATIILTGCAHSHFTRINTMNGAVAREDAQLPVYTSPPTQPYKVIGEIDVETSHLRNPDKVASARAIAEGANALILISEGTSQLGEVHDTFSSSQNYGTLTTHETTGVNIPIRHKTASYLAITIEETTAQN